MKNLIIIGARGMGRFSYHLALECPGYQKDYQIKGFLDDKKDALDGFNSYPEILNSVENYIIDDDDVFICALGDVQAKIKYINMIIAKGGEFITLIHPSAHVDTNAIIGKGCIVLQNAVIGPESIIGNFVLIQISAIIGHDSIIGNYSRIDNLVVCVGGVILEDEVTIHTSAIINHKVVVGKGAIVGAASFVIRRVKEYSTVYGNPAIRLK